MPLYRCPFPNCDHTCYVFTVNHCESKHHMTKKELIATYGPPAVLKMDNIIAFPSKNNKES